MATILRTYKYINLFTGYYLKSYQSNFSPLKLILKSNYAALHPDRNYATVAVTKFLHDKPKPTPGKIVELIKERYLQNRSSMYPEVDLLLKSIVNENSSVLPASIGLVLEKDIQLLIHCCGKAMKGEMPSVRSKLLNTLWQVFKTTGLPLNVSHYNALLSAYLENEQDFSPAEILLEMSNNNIQPDELTYEYLLTYYCRNGNIEEANRILNFLKESEIPVNENIFNALIIGNAEANDINGALNILSIMKGMGCRPTSKTYASLLTAYAKKGDIENILKTLENCEHKDIIILDKYKMDIIYHLVRNGHKEHIAEMLSTLSRDTSFHMENKNLISRLMQIREVDVAIKVLLASKKAGIPENQLNAAAQPFARNITKLDWPEEKIIESFNLLESEGFNMYEDALYHCLDEKIIIYTVPLLRAWSKLGFQVREPLFWPLLANYGSGNVQGVLETLQLMKNEFAVKPSLETLTRFVLPFIKTSNPRDIMDTLIRDCQIPAELTVNAVLYHDLSKNKIDSALISAKHSAGYNINYNTRLLYPLLENALKKTDDLTSYNLIKSIIQGKNTTGERRESGDRQQGYFILPTLRTINLGFKLKEFSEKGDLKAAQNCIQELKRYNRCKLSIDKLLSYFDLLVKNDKLEDALQLLEDFAPEEMCTIRYNKETRDQCTSSLSSMAEKGIVEGVNKLYDFLSKKDMDAAMQLTESLVQVHLVQNNPKAAIEVVKKIQKDHGYIPARTKLMKALIESEEVESLQWLTDFSIKHQGESVTLLPLAVAFLKCQRIRQCRRILESANSPLRDDLVRNSVNTFFAEDDISSVKEYIQVTKGLVSINRNILYDMLLEKYSLLNNWKEGLALWQQMQTEKVTPSELFLVILEELLNRNEQSVPFSVPKSIYDQEEQNDFYTKLTKIYLKTKAYPSREFLDHLVHNLVEAGNTKMIELIENNWLNLYAKYLKNKPIKFDACVKSNEVHSYLSKIKKSVDTGDNVELMKFIKSIDFSSVKYLLSHPESVNLFESLAVQINLDRRNSFFKPLLAVLSYYFIKDDPRAVELWDNSTKNLHQSYSSYSFLTKSFILTDNFDKLPQLAMRLDQCENHNKRMFYEAFLNAYAGQNKYEDGLRVLAKFKPKPREVKQEKSEDKVENTDDLPPVKSQVAL
ncbi:leucine-rich PPR motif-containing protein, mitochondrial [Belonocnema kinseyi]|uniref:leucine-rich PPR motif-containing protein, mitochondrial n=1 Tax=Belonocnema kinseyi TaxID=2817044 RepID=UPI00143D1679|nr:leucine-rich PPR motif-containing protein, mitochondrial [Belonocnema kinseyi]XP_033211723.1 leucine-rich PPR motif-containing protein, mitochondrial [Belonocnema kinseyi]